MKSSRKGRGMNNGPPTLGMMLYKSNDIIWDETEEKKCWKKYFRDFNGKDTIVVAAIQLLVCWKMEQIFFKEEANLKEAANEGYGSPRSNVVPNQSQTIFPEKREVLIKGSRGSLLQGK